MATSTSTNYLRGRNPVFIANNVPQVSGGIAWLDDIQQFYRERSAIEKEYSEKLSALAKKYYEKKARKSSSLSVGDTPTVTPGSLERYDPGAFCSETSVDVFSGL
jgi:hypothetical protein